MDNPNSYHTSQRGVALIMVLGMVAIIAAWASTAAYEDMISLRRASNIQDEVRATMAIESTPPLVKAILIEDHAIDTSMGPDYDTLEDIWAMEQPPFPIDSGMIAATIIDANRFYNLNDLVDDNGVIIQDHVYQVRTMFFNLGIDPDLVDALADWMDKDNKPAGVSGAEDSAYYSQDYEVKNARLDNWSELKLILGFDYQVLAKLKETTAIYKSTSGKININTATVETLKALFPDMTDQDAEILIEDRENTPFETASDITSYMRAQPWNDPKGISRLSVKSDTFMLRAHATFGQSNVREEFLLSRQGKNVQVLKRERLGWQF